jgi:hypothetical protein
MRPRPFCELESLHGFGRLLPAIRCIGGRVRR